MEERLNLMCFKPLEEFAEEISSCSELRSPQVHAIGKLELYVVRDEKRKRKYSCKTIASAHNGS